jgi:hypothetical protein
MLTSTAIALIPTLVLSARTRAKEVIKKVNQTCIDKKVPQAFEVGEIENAQNLDDIYFRCSPDFRFEGFGMDVGLPPKLTFWVWYKKGTPEGVEIGKFHMNMGTLSEIALSLVPIAKAGALLGKVDDVIDLVENVTEAANETDH